MRKNGEPQRFSDFSVEMVRPDGSAISLTTAGSEQHEGCALRIRKDAVRTVAILGLAVGLLGGGKVVSAQIPCGGYEVSAIIQVDECPPFGFPPTIAEGLNEQGWMVGWFRACVIGPDVAWFWTPELGLQVIPMPAGTTFSRAVAISGSLIVGQFDNPNELGRTGFLYDLETDQFTPASAHCPAVTRAKPME